MKKITFGRLQDNDIIFDDQSVSRHHGYLLVDGSKVYAVDNDSLNGIFVNGKRINDKVLLSRGDKVLVANLFKLDWQRYSEDDKEKTILLDTQSRKNDDVSHNTEKKKDWKNNSFWKTARKILKYILTTVVTLAIMALINKWLR